MGVDLSLIIPNECRSLRDTESVKKCFYDAIGHVIEYFHGRKQFVAETSASSNGDNSGLIEYGFETDRWNAIKQVRCAKRVILPTLRMPMCKGWGHRAM